MNDSPVNPDVAMDETTRACLLAALTELQNTIRAYDTKAQIMGIGFLFSMGMIANFLSKIDIERIYSVPYLIAGFILLLGPVVLFGLVLHPSRRTDPRLQSSLTGVRQCFYFVGDGQRTPESFLADTVSADWRREIVYEIAKLSALRDLKRRRFLRAMTAAGLSFAIIATTNVLRMGGVI